MTVKTLRTLVAIVIVLTAWAVGHVQGQAKRPVDLPRQQFIR